MPTESAAQASDRLWLARIFGVLSLALGALFLFIAFAEAMSAGAGEALLSSWMGLLLACAGAIPFIPALAQRHWQWKARVSLVYLVCLSAMLGEGLIQFLVGEEDSTTTLVAVGLYVLLAAPAAWLLYKGLGPRIEISLPAATTTGDSVVDELQQAHEPTRAVIVAASLLGWSAALAGLIGLQVLDVTFYTRWVNYVPYALLGFAAALAWCALGVYKLRFVQGAAAFVLAALGSLGGGAWLVFSARGGLLSLFAMIWPVVSAAAAVAALRQLGYLRAASEAREKLEDAGFGLGL